MKNLNVSIIILNWNGKKWLGSCLKSWRRVTYKPKEIIVVDNGSTDDSAKYLKISFPEVKVIRIKKNIGFAGGNNMGVKKAKGKYVLLLNNDTKVTPTLLKNLVEDMENNPEIGVVQPQMRSMIYPKLLDSVISYTTNTGILYHFGYMKKAGKKIYRNRLFGYSVKGACMMMRRKDFIQLGGLDEDFVCYVEESDLCHRVWLSGKKVLYEPNSIVYHWGGGDMQIMTKSELTVFRSFRNRIISNLKNLSMSQLVLVLPVLFLFSEGYILLSLIKGKIRQALAAQAGVLAWTLDFPRIMEKRAYIQKHIRKVSDRDINTYIKKNPRFSYYYQFFSDPRKYKD